MEILLFGYVWRALPILFTDSNELNKIINEGFSTV